MVKINIIALLQGARLFGESMRINLAEQGLLPTASEGAYPAGDYPDVIQQVLPGINDVSRTIVDWVIVTLRSKHDITDIIAQKACIILSDGRILDTDGNAVSFQVAANSYFVSVAHRNHFEIATAATVALSSTPTTIDFTTASTDTHGGAGTRIEVGNGELAMPGGDVNRDQFSDNTDQALAAGFSTTPEYSDRDVTMTGLFDGSDLQLATENATLGLFGAFAI